ncbi:MAG: class I SAM-dependent DNA methyltransferase [Bacteroidia bacterium]
MSANERTFQGELYRIINDIISGDSEINFTKITQEENVGTKGKARFADGKLYSSINKRKIVSFELKNNKWDATDDILVLDAAQKAMNNGYEYFVTGTPRQLVVFKTFEEGVPLNERKLKIYNISNVKKDDDILLSSYEKEIQPKLKVFLKELSDLIHGIKEVRWDSIDKFFVNKLSAYILEASAEMLNPMYEKINKNKTFREKLKNYLKSQDIFNVTLNFDGQDVYKISQLSNYLLYLKIIFYSYLQRDVPELKLKPLEIPEDKKLLNKTLRQRFDDVLKHDFEMIFSENILDEFEFEDKYLPVLKHNVEQIKRLNFTDLNADIIGSIYNTLIDNQEQHDRGQHFTNTNEVDIVNAFCIKDDTKFVLDSGCGAGTFLVRAYFFLKKHHPNLTHQQLLERVWGVEIASFPVFLSTMNLSLLDIKTLDNYPVIIHSDFAKVKSNSSYSGIFLNVSKTFKVKNLGEKKCEVSIPTFDACVGNPPYIRQELINGKDEWSHLAKVEFGLNKINQQSDLYVYYLMHTAAFLKEGGRFGYVIASSWLDVSFGAGLQKFLLDHFKIIAVIDHQKKRSFETASVNTVILILEKCSDLKEREKNNVKFVRVFADYEAFIGNSSDKDRFERVNEFALKIESQGKSQETDEMQIAVIKQSDLENQSTFEGKYTNGYWGAKFLRSPKIYNKIIAAAKEKFRPLSIFADVKYGIKTGANEFFYLIDDTEKTLQMENEEYKLVFGQNKSTHQHIWKNNGWFLSELNGQHFIIEREYVMPLFKTQKEAKNLDVDLGRLKYFVFSCSETKSKLSKLNKHALKYINLGESKQFQVNKRPSVSGREPWYDISNIVKTGDFIFPSKIGEKYRLIDNRVAQVACDKVNYIVEINPEYKKYDDALFLILNSITFRYFIDLFSRQLTGNQTLSDVDVNLVEKTPILNPELLNPYKNEIKEICRSIKKREQGTIHEEIEEDDKFKLDLLIFKSIGLTEKDVRELHKVASQYVRDRQDKSASLTTTKSKQKLGYDDAIALVSDRFSDIKRYREIIKGMEVQKLSIPDAKAIYPKGGVGSENLFGIYNVYFNDGKKQKSLSFDSPQQLELFEFLNNELEIKNTDITLPKDSKECKRVLKMIKDDFEDNLSVIKVFLKSNRSNANPLSVYRDLLLRK